ncbi:MAG: SpoIIE family protein phosphatase [Sulfitobacter sp.]|nr:SpoIIE family protein phosphatase [Sulfitobacter sp.]
MVLIVDQEGFDGGLPREGAGRLVLVVDDSRMQRRLLVKLLLRWGFDVIEAEDGNEALSLCRTHRPDIILSDWVMPGLSGPEFCAAFRRLSGSRYAYFILLTSKSEKDEVAEGLDSGADDFLVKPVNGSELRARITAGERIIEMQRALTETNRKMADTLAELRRVYDSLDKDLQEARDLQQSLIRERFRAFDVGNLSLVLRSSGHVGGDLVGFFPVDGRHLGLFGIDVSGHGISSALMTARLAGYLTAGTPDHNIALGRDADDRVVPRPPSEVVTELNELVLGEMETEHYFTLMLAFLDMQTGLVTLSQAGHPHPIIQRANGLVEQEGPGGLPVGLVEGARYEAFEIQLEPGDRLMILSDGVTECPDRAGNLLGEQGLERIIVRLRDIRDTAFLEALIWELARFAGSEEFPDDVSALVFDYKGPPETD